MNPPVMHFDKTIASPGKRAVVRGHNERDTFLGDQIEEQLKDCGTRLLVERTRGFICEQNSRLVHQGAAQCSPLALSSRELLNSMIQPRIEPGALCQVSQTGYRRLTGNARRHSRDEAVFFESEIRYEVMKLEDEADLMPEQTERAAMAIDLHAVDRDAAAVRFVQPAKQMK
jgi:hypothetical protein